ncbi:hypothetical protein [Robiginitalea sp. IMCC43444]|uniref:hypothetical protein n=1 Tax=Robiginitalea sp. IMCC43444 TaxID=3459121 RepID=UPI004042530E
MKTAKSVLSILLIMGCLSVAAQEVVKAEAREITHKTILESYESDLILPREARMDLKRRRIQYILSRRAILDTLDIPLKKKRKLLRELYLTPFSSEWDKVLASMGFEDRDSVEE